MQLFVSMELSFKYDYVVRMSFPVCAK